MQSNNLNLEAFFQHYRILIDRRLAQAIRPSAIAPSLHEAMRYSLLNGGKRIRPLLMLATVEATDGKPELALDAAAAVELIHCYSLIHDDLPAMDDDDLRRGKPTCHIQFDEATAILAGDALQTKGFELLANAEQFSETTRLRLIQCLTQASGPLGMVGGQAVDLSAVGKRLDLLALQQMHKMKTGALLEACVLMGAYCNQLSNGQTVDTLRRFAADIGLAFQIKDDILDVEVDTATLGKTGGKDAANQKPTYTSLLGLHAAKVKADELRINAIDALKSIGLEHSRLAEIAHYVVDRNR